MQVKTEQDEIQSFLRDASNTAPGRAERVLVPESAAEAARALAEAARAGTPVTVAGAGTGVVGGRVPAGGVVLSTHRLDRIGEVARDEAGGCVVAQAGVALVDVHRRARSAGLFYPPDPTEWSCFVGGSVATNASGARTFKYGPTRRYVRRLQVALTTGDLIELRRGAFRADRSGRLGIPLGGGRSIEAQLPSYSMPATSKHAAGYFVEPGVDAVDLFVGSEGTLGVVTEAELALLPLPPKVLSGVVFFDSEEKLLSFVEFERRRSRSARWLKREGYLDPDRSGVEARVLEYFDAESLAFLRGRHDLVPAGAAGAVYFEQELEEESEERLIFDWSESIENHGGLMDSSWFAVDEHDRDRISAFRHDLPVMVNEWLARHGQRKVSTDMAVPDAAFAEMLDFYRETLRTRRLKYVIFGHIGDNHLHVNILPRDEDEAAAARDIYGHFIRKAVALGGTISAEHGVGKLKRPYLRELYGEEHLREMAALKRAFDPAGILGRGNIFDEELIGTAEEPGRTFD
ncbi:MAG TPA: FAD-binding oxidoreductase [Pyrinomonadaceae bacterium]|nr:FAD-binding oxidoreductase [Pyrinomonadaceae bacterium]